MRFVLLNLTSSYLQVDIYNPEIKHRNRSLNRPGPALALRLRNGEARDILPHFGSLEKTYRAIRYSKDVLRLLRPNQLHITVLDDDGNELDIDALMNRKPHEATVPVIDEIVPVTRPRQKEPKDPKDLTEKELKKLKRKEEFKAEIQEVLDRRAFLEKMNRRELIALYAKEYGINLAMNQSKNEIVSKIILAEEKIKTDQIETEPVEETADE